MPCSNKMRNMLLFSATQQNFCLICLCGILRTPENSLFPLNGTGVDGREVGRWIRREGQSVTLETAPKEGGQLDRMECKGSVAPLAPPHPLLTWAPLCHVVLPQFAEPNSIQWPLLHTTLQSVPGRMQGCELQ